MMLFIAGLFAQPGRPAGIPFARGELSRNDYEPVTVSLSRKDAKRCIEAMEWYIESFAEQMIERGQDKEVARYEDLMYRFMGMPDVHAETRRGDLWD
jgi:hypothetical protein